MISFFFFFFEKLHNFVPLKKGHNSFFHRALKKWDTLLNADKAEQIRLGREGGRGGPYLIEIQRKLQCQVTLSALPPHNRPRVGVRPNSRIHSYSAMNVSAFSLFQRRRQEEEGNERGFPVKLLRSASQTWPHWRHFETRPPRQRQRLR